MISIRAHHLLCMQGFQGHGYNKAFVANFYQILNQIEKNPDEILKVTIQTDSFCFSCPHRRDQLCKKDETAQERMQSLDRKVLEKLEVSERHQAPADELLNFVNKTLRTQEDVKEICGNCQWRLKCKWYQSRDVWKNDS